VGGWRLGLNFGLGPNAGNSAPHSITSSGAGACRSIRQQKFPWNLHARQIPVEPGNIRVFFAGHGEFLLYSNNLTKFCDRITGNFFALTGKRIGKTGN
jgi:hypothetical protein